MKRVLLTGWAGFIGSNLVRHLIKETDWHIIGVDSITYAAQPDWALSIRNGMPGRQRFTPLEFDICNEGDMRRVFKEFKPEIVIHLAAETHVCRSLEGPKDFVMTNVVGTFNLLQAAAHSSRDVLFHHVSTDEVYGELGSRGQFTEKTRYKPRSPYSASKAASDHLVMAYHHSYDLDVRISNCSNNFGPNQHEEKLIPKTILCALKDEPLSIYGPGTQIRDWIWVDEHCSGILAAIQKGKPGGQYLFGGDCEISNRGVVETVWNCMESMGLKPGRKMAFTNARPKDDKRYSIDCSLAGRRLGWVPDPSKFRARLEETILWYKAKLEAEESSKKSYGS